MSNSRFEPGEVISYTDMCQSEGQSLQQGMNFRRGVNTPILLMSRRPSAPYDDRLEHDGTVLLYEGHNEKRSADCPDPKAVDQPLVNKLGRPTQNGLFLESALAFKRGDANAVEIRVYEKIMPGIWVYVGVFKLTDGWQESSNNRIVLKLRLEIATLSNVQIASHNIDHTRLIPTDVKRAVWKRDAGRCVQCGSVDNLHFDHIIPYSKGGSSILVDNIQLLCARHNLAKHDKIL